MVRNIPNALTIARIFLAILVMAIILYADMQSGSVRFIACGIFFFASVTDFLDGFIARCCSAQSRFGEVFDPLADKMLILGAFIALLAVGLASPWAVFLILSREFLVAGLRIVVADHGGHNIAVDMFGKTKSVMQYWAIGCLIAQVLPSFWNQFFLWLAVALTLTSGINYTRAYLGILK